MCSCERGLSKKGFLGNKERQIVDCQRLHWKATHKHECAQFKAEAEAKVKAKEAEEKAGAAGGVVVGEMGQRAGAAMGGRLNRSGRDEKCPCGGGKKYKKCHGAN